MQTRSFLTQTRSFLTALSLLGLCAALPALAWAEPRGRLAAQEPEALAQRFEELDTRGDQAAIVELWRAHPDETLYVIDSYLEGSLALVEKAKGAKHDEAKVAAMEARALRAARAADLAFGRTLFGDYAAAFASWDPEQQKRFRAGQKAYGASRSALKKGDAAAALAKGEECVELARPLGDWWGTAMGLSAVGLAQEQLGAHGAALEAASQGALLYAGLGLRGDEYGCLLTCARACVATKQYERGLLFVERALPASAAFEDAAGELQLLEAQVGLERIGGNAERLAAAEQALAAKRK